MNAPKILVCLFSDANGLSINILENLLSKNCFVWVVTKDLKRWQALSGHLSQNRRFVLVNAKKTAGLPAFNYSIFCGGFLKKKDTNDSYTDYLKNKDLIAEKTITLFPFEGFSLLNNISPKINDNGSIIYIGDLIGPRMDFDSDLLVSRVISETISERRMTLAVGEVFYPMFITDVAKTICSWLFSFGPYGKELILLGPQVSGTEFWQENQRIINALKLNYDEKRVARTFPRGIESKTIPTDINFALSETYKWLRSSLPERPVMVVKKAPKKYPKWLKTFLVSAFCLLGLPVVLALLSTGLLFWTAKDMGASSAGAVTTKILIAKTLFTVSEGESQVFGYVPFFGIPYREVAFVSSVGKQISDVALSATPLVNKASGFFNNILGTEIYDPSVYAQEMSGTLDLLYQEILVLEANTVSAKDSGVVTARIVTEKVNFEKVKNFIQQGRIIVNNLPDLLGKSGRKTYLVLFQNNTELRPTGGFIGSFGLLTFDGGRMTDLLVNDVYSADGQLRGHVEPPDPIKNYLGEANWWLRDSNWDPDFPTSARRAEWFLDKEMDQKVDGVFAIDLNLVREALKITGPIFLADYDLNITSDNLYEKTQNEVEEKFFPGSRRKASFLTALSRNLITEVEKLQPKQRFLVMALIFKNFNERHLQVFLHQLESQAAISAIGWSGEVAKPSCGDACYADLVGLTEANLGVNKSNYFISRQVTLDVEANQQKIARRLTLKLKNSANTALGESGTYKVYIRVFIPNSSVLTSVKDVTGYQNQTLPVELSDSHGMKEAGVLVEVLGGQTKNIEFIWTTDPKTDLRINAYGLYVRKQAGVSDDPWNINISVPKSALTKTGVYTYNTILAQDFIKRLSF